MKRDLYSLFKLDRDQCVNAVAVETNNLIIRLDKLLNECPEEQSRKEFEKETVPWMANTQSCSVCGSKFGLSRRRHHCRLCGSVICKDCCQFLPFVNAHKLINPAFTDADFANFSLDNNTGKSSFVDGSSIRMQTGKLFSSIGIPASFIPSTSKPSLQDQSLRICCKCKTLLEKRQEQMDRTTMPAVFVGTYDKLCQLILEMSNLAPSYRRMAESLRNGETMYSLSDAGQLRQKVGSLQKEIQAICDSMQKCDCEDEIRSRELSLRRNITLAAFTAMQDSLRDMPNLPSSEEYKELQQKHKERMKRQMAEEREYMNGVRAYPSNPVLTRDRSVSPGSNAHRNSTSGAMRTSSSFSGLQHDGGWTPEPTGEAFNPFTDPNTQIHPLQQQHIIIKNYLMQAAKAGRVGELETLEQNLKDIEAELKKNNLSTPRAE